MQARLLTLVILLVAFASQARAQGPGGMPMLDTFVVNMDMNYDLKYIKMDIEVTPDTEYVAGNILFRGIAVEGPFIDKIMLNLREQIFFDSAQTEGGGKLAFNRVGEHVMVSLDGPKQPGEAFAVRVFYHGFSTFPDRGGLIHTTQKQDTTGGNVIWSTSEPYGAKTWWPVHDNQKDKIDSCDLWFTCKDSFAVASNGLLQEVTQLGDGRHTYKWKSTYQIAHYLIAFACTRYDTFTTYWKYSATDSLPIQNFVYPGETEAWKNGLKVIPDILNTFTSWFGPYPFLREKYGHAQWRGGGMENQTISFVQSCDTSLLAHEAAHQWWGDAITCATWNEIWLNEGFATYFASRYLGHAQGEQAHLIDMAQKERFVTSKPDGSVFVFDSSLTDVKRVFDGRTTYDKGAWVLYMLRYLLGDSTFDAALKSWMMGPHRYGVGTTPEFVQHLESVTGKSLQKFFGQWVFAEGYPQYQFSPQSAPLFGQWRSIIYLNQVPSTTPIFYEMPVEVRVEGDGWDSLLVLNNTQYGQSWDMTFEKEPKRWVFDPFNHILDGRVDQYLKVETASTEGILRLQQNPVKRGQPLNVIMTAGYYLKGFEVTDTRGASLIRDSAMYRDRMVSLPIGSLPAGAYTIRMSIMDDKGEVLQRLEKFIIE